MNSRWLILLLAILWLNPISAQTGKREDISELLDDGGISNAKNLLKLNLVQPLAGDFSLAFERQLSKKFTLQANIGKVLPFYLIDLSGLYNRIALSDPRQDLSNLTGGFSFGLTPKYFLRGLAPEYYYLALDYQYRRYNRTANYDLVFTDYQFLSGFSQFFGTRFVLEFYVGLGIRQFKYEAKPGNRDLSVLNRIIPNLPLGLRVGIIL